jgi:peptidyl-prolyl cis-trans isomerase SurA
MPRLCRRFTAAFVLALTGAFAPAIAAAAASDTGASDLDRIVAVVNDDIVLASELAGEMARTRERLQRNDRDVPPDSVLRQRLLEQLVMQQIQLQRAERAGIEVDRARVNEALRNMADQNGTDLAGLRQRSADDGIDFQRLRADVRDRLIVSRLRQREVASQVEISDDQIAQALERMEKASARRTEYKLRHILIAVPAEAQSAEVADARDKAQQVVTQLRADDAAFAATATRVSDGPQALSGGDLGWRSATSLPELFLDALRELEPGAVSEPLRSPNGFHVVKLVERRGGQSQSITEVRARHILVREEGQAEAGSANPRQRLASLREQLRAGAAFGDLARRYSDDQSSARKGGDLGWIGPGEMTPAFQKVLKGLDPGTLSEPFRTPYGWHLVEVLERRQRQDVEQYRRAKARRALYQREVEQQTQRWRQRLRDQAYVDLRLAQ